MKTHLPITLVFILHSFFILQAQNFEIDTQLFASGLNQPLGIENVGDSRLFIPEKPGTISIVNANGSVEPTPFLDITNLVTTNGERGLLGLAFHPNYTTNGYFYVNYTNTSGNTVISRFSVSADNPNLADENTELQLLTYNQPFANHNGGDLTFGPDGMLYIASGDGGSGGDPGERAQSLNTLLGKILRLNDDGTIPDDNPFSDSPVYSLGHRNPQGMTWDDDGNMFVAEIGPEKNDEIIFVGVKTVSKEQLGSPELKIDAEKISKLEKAIDSYLIKNDITKDIRLDIITVFLRKGRPIINHYKGIDIC